MLRNVVVAAVVALVCALPAAAEEGKPRPAEAAKPRAKEVRIVGTVLRASEAAVAVENEEGDSVLTCTVPERLAEKAASLKAGERIKMICVRPKGKRARLVALHRAVERKQSAAGTIVEVDEETIVVSGEARLVCRIPVAKQEKLAALKIGDKVKIVCAGGTLVALERAAPVKGEKPAQPAGEDVRLYGRIAELSLETVTVRGEAGALTCRVPAGLAEKLARFAVGDAVKMMCRGADLTYLEKTA